MAALAAVSQCCWLTGVDAKRVTESGLLDDLQVIMTAAQRRTRGRTVIKRWWGWCGQVREDKRVKGGDR